MDTTSAAPKLTAQTVSRTLRRANVNIAPVGMVGLHAHGTAVPGSVCITADHELTAQAARASRIAEQAARDLGYVVTRHDGSAATFYVSLVGA